MNKTLLRVLTVMLSGVLIHAVCFSGEAMASQEGVEGIPAPAELLNELRPRFQAIVFAENPATNEEARSEQFVLMTNVSRSVTMTDCLDETDVEAGVESINWVMALPTIKSDTMAIEYCAEAILDICPVSTNSYERELKVAHDEDVRLMGDAPRGPGTVTMGRYWGPNLKAFNRKWRLILEYNRNCEEIRQRAVKSFKRKFPNETNLIARIEAPSLRVKPKGFQVQRRMKGSRTPGGAGGMTSEDRKKDVQMQQEAMEAKRKTDRADVPIEIDL